MTITTSSLSNQISNPGNLGKSKGTSKKGRKSKNVGSKQKGLLPKRKRNKS